MKVYLTIFLTHGLLMTYGQNCEWSIIKANKDTTYFLSNPIDIGENVVKEKVYLQGIIIGNNRLLVVNVKNDAIKTTDKIIFKGKNGDLVVKSIDVNKKILIAKLTAVFTDPAKRPSEKRIYFSELESDENRFIFFEITPSDIKKFKRAEFISFQTTDASIELVKPASKQLKTMIRCLK
jgi:hypothetical protein